MRIRNTTRDGLLHYLETTRVQAKSFSMMDLTNWCISTIKEVKAAGDFEVFAYIRGINKAYDKLPAAQRKLPVVDVPSNIVKEMKALDQAFKNRY
ncbi:hypothetical protein pETSU_116 [Edwardsiella phage pEt-SU]|uniref:Uncharacterized protein n=1 Tax=Edwardsiella phage pEt-SU TaxID=2562142 RepID=A0A4D6DWE8_9CAUD|nr:hypothetical protein HOV39_gp116 [Edwardsiella phage pEt-SU]QBZ70697.1 hypothetical protein pETSU_116 [Edwardsiella phage pEt-SU]